MNEFSEKRAVLNWIGSSYDGVFVSFLTMRRYNVFYAHVQIL